MGDVNSFECFFFFGSTLNTCQITQYSFFSLSLLQIHKLTPAHRFVLYMLEREQEYAAVQLKVSPAMLNLDILIVQRCRWLKHKYNEIQEQQNML